MFPLFISHLKWGSAMQLDDEIARASRARKGTPFLSTEQAAFYLGLSARKLQQMRAQGVGPRFRRHSRYVRYHIDDLDDWSKGLSRFEGRACLRR